MNFTCTRLLLRSSSSLIKAHCRKLYKGSPGTFSRFSLSPHCRHLTWKVNNPQDPVPNNSDLFEEAIEPNYQDANVEEITGGDPEKARKLNLCQMEINVAAQNGAQVPRKMTTEFWCELIKIPSYPQRTRYLRFLWLKEKKRDNAERKKLENRKQYEEVVAIRGKKDRSEMPTNAPVKYGLSDTSLVHRFRDTHINKFYNYKLLQAMMWGPHIVVDCGYEAFMSPREMNLCVKQLLFMWSENREHKNPFDVIFCNFKETSPIFKKLQKTLVGLGTDPAFPFNYTDKHYLDLFPKEKLVYLTPHCNNNLKKFDGNDIYIIGAMVDKSHSEPVSISKAKKDGIRYAKLPLDLHLNWKQGIKSLTLNQCLAIMNDVKDGRDWPYAFRHVPRRKLNDYSIDEETREIRETKHSAKSIKERFRRNQVYDLLLPSKKK